MYQSAQAAITEYYRLHGLNNRHLLLLSQFTELYSHNSGGQKFVIKMPANSVSGASSLPSLKTASCSLSSYGFPSAHWLVSLPLFRRTSVLLNQSLNLMTSFNFNYPLKILQSHWKLGFQCILCWVGEVGDTIPSITESLIV